MIRIGVTGGIGSGKTTFCKHLEKLGAYVVFADDVAKELMVSNKDVVDQIQQTFGAESYHPDGSLNRAFLAEQAFAKNRVEELNAIVHPILWQHIDELAASKEKNGIKFFVKEAALLLKNGRQPNTDVIVLLLADEQSRIHRVVNRDDTSEQQVIHRVDKQDSFDDLVHLADFVIENNGSIEDLKTAAEKLLNSL